MCSCRICTSRSLSDCVRICPIYVLEPAVFRIHYGTGPHRLPPPYHTEWPSVVLPVSLPVCPLQPECVLRSSAKRCDVKAVAIIFFVFIVQALGAARSAATTCLSYSFYLGFSDSAVSHFQRTATPPFDPPGPKTGGRWAFRLRTQKSDRP